MAFWFKLDPFLSADYDSSLAPKQTKAGVKVDEPLPIHVGVDIMSFDKIDTVHMMFRSV